MNKIFIVLSALIFFVSSAICEVVSREIVCAQTLQNNPSIIAAKLKLDNARLAYNRSLGAYFPVASLSGSSGQGETNGGYSRDYSFGLNVSLSVFSGFETYNDVKIKSVEVNSSQISYNRTVSDALYETIVQYVNLVWAYETAELSKQIYERRKENRDMINLKYNSGNVDVGSLERVEADVEMAGYDLRKAKRYIETASAALLKAIGRNGDAILETSEKLELDAAEIKKPDFNVLVAQLPEFLTVKFSAQIAKLQAAKTKNLWMPDISVSGAISRSGGQWFPDNRRWNAGISVSYTLFNGGQRYADVKSAKNLAQIAEENLKDSVNSLKAKAVARYNSLADYYENVAVRRHYLKAASLQAEISARKYVNGLTTYQDWYSIENDFINSQKNLLDAKKNASLEKAAWDNFLGK
ncbi:MAG: TolC family protein [Endomicrobium sp.]|jgi:outer membrane protein TolC|nr:TolC family protein [Endomicrobium sp.]